MKKYRVVNAVLNAEQIKGNESYSPNIRDVFVGDYIDADSEEEAIEIAIDCIAEEIRNNNYNGYEIETTKEEIKVYNDGEEIERYYNFEATEIE